MADFFVGSDTESAVLDFTQHRLEMGPVRLERSAAKTTQLIPFNTSRQGMATVIELPGPKLRYRVFDQSASEVLLSKSSRIIRDPTERLPRYSHCPI